MGTTVEARETGFSCERKVRIPRELYAALQEAQERYQVPGGVSGIVRRAIRAAATRGGVAGDAPAQPATRDGSTVLTVFLPRYLARWLDSVDGAGACAAIHDYLQRQRPGPPAPVPAEILAEERRLQAMHQALGTQAVVGA